MKVESLADRPDIDIGDAAIIGRVRSFTMTSVERLSALVDAVRYVSRQRIPGSIVECGVWRGGSMMAAALTLIEEADRERELYLYDTFDGMTQPNDDHDQSFDNKLASAQLRDRVHGAGVLCKASLEDVKQNVSSTGYPSAKTHYVRGKVESTIPEVVPKSISVLRLDTDWYESTRHELQFLFPLISPGGLLIIDDYGHWKGARKACDEYFEQLPFKPFLNRIDYTGRIMQIPYKGREA